LKPDQDPKKMSRKILAISGSDRNDSQNMLVLRAVVAALSASGSDVTTLTLRDLAIPIYDGDLEAGQGLPAGVTALRTALTEHDGLLIACPEYNGFMTPLLLNAIDWASRSPDAKPDLSVFKDKVTGIVSTSPGALGGMRSSTHLRTMLTGIGCIVIPDNLALGRSFEVFENGQIKQEHVARVEGFATRFTGFVDRLG
jgi:chromate reductase